MEPPFTWDLAVIGGGVNGAAIARDAAGRGLSVLLLERGDLAQGTSSASTKLIHGGLRYLEHREFALVRESLHEREILWRQAPHIVWPMRFVVPLVGEGRPAWMLRAGLWLYDHMGGREALPPTARVDLSGEMGLRERIRAGYEYSDCWVDDARLVVLLARDAADRGAEVVTRCEVTRLAREGSGWRIETRGANGGEPFRAAMVVNAAGPQVGGVMDLAHEARPPLLRRVRGSHIVVPRLHDDPRALFLQLADGRICFAIPYEHAFTLIGTTDSEEGADIDPPRPSAAEIAYLCEAVGRYFRRPPTPADVVWAFAGVRLLADDGSGKPEAATRGYHFDLDRGRDAHSAPLLSVLGGKITTHRTLAEAALERLGIEADTGWTATAPLPGGDFVPDGLDEADNLISLEQEIAVQSPGMARPVVHRLARAYGTEALRFVRADMGRDFGHGFSEAELEHLMRREWAVTAEDVLWRRSKAGLRFDAAQVAALSAAMGEGA
ncbi:glycerol-3-phosphate dehydrogenase [Novosphingobium sp. KCTC 2891]|uniref:glycerol-3-phosphate dehydrogenase n=1 Tax=Novosphingobium sp. KCTC 2891 TaxID=2989730 RepID=UPI0022216B12|nr:glycerol-3-phosphate dehydrogenase [Novosphingobium sp. KCTC 2891]MCW1382293.1 glycerol-3-phosphate dehydrogenase [Novosphingobium sp. KCTC 2891]